MEKAGPGSAYYAAPSAPPYYPPQPAAGVPVAPPYYPPQPAARVPVAPPYYPPQPAARVPVAPPYYPPQPVAPASFHMHGGHQRSQWSSGLCNCCDDVGNCCITCWCPCIPFGQIAEIVDRGNTSCGASGAIYGFLCSLTGFQCIYSCFYRSKLRSQYGLPQSPCADCLVHCCCEPCALCQEYRELRSRGYDMEYGWQGNMDRWATNQTVPPLAPAGMMK